MSKSHSKFSSTNVTGDSNRDSISERAYRIWQENGQPTGRDEEFWLKAEKEILEGGAANIQGTGAVSAQQLKESTDANRALAKARR